MLQEEGLDVFIEEVGWYLGAKKVHSSACTPKVPHPHKYTPMPQKWAINATEIKEIHEKLTEFNYNFTCKMNPDHIYVNDFNAVIMC